jgi:ribosomal protein S18 acetylase RimI-like enzyme
MSARVIQGLFIGGRPKLPSPVQPKLVAPSVQSKAAWRRPGPPAPAFVAARPPGPPAPAFAAAPAAVQRHTTGGAFAVEAGQLGLASVGGRPLPDAVRGKMEAALGTDFSNVRVHVGPQAERIGAIAFTIGSDIYFAPGRYQPDSMHGQQLLGHELAHVVQQRAGRVRNPLGSGIAVVQDHALEAEADRLGQRAANHLVAVQAKMPPRAAQPSVPARISAPVSSGPGSYRLTAGSGGRQVGSVTVHARDKGAVEVTDLHVAEAQRGHGVGRMLVASAAKAGLQLGKSKVSLAAQDNGSGHLTQWYKGLGFTQTGVNNRGYPQLEAPISRVLTGTAQRLEERGIARGRQGLAIQRMDLDPMDERELFARREQINASTARGTAGTVARAWIEYQDFSTSPVFSGESGKWENPPWSNLVKDHIYSNPVKDKPINGKHRGGDAECHALDKLIKGVNVNNLGGTILFVEIAGATEICQHCKWLLNKFVRKYHLLAWRSEGTGQGNYFQ